MRFIFVFFQLVLSIDVAGASKGPAFSVLHFKGHEDHVVLKHLVEPPFVGELRNWDPGRGIEHSTEIQSLLTLQRSVISVAKGFGKNVKGKDPKLIKNALRDFLTSVGTNSSFGESFSGGQGKELLTIILRKPIAVSNWIEDDGGYGIQIPLQGILSDVLGLSERMAVCPKSGSGYSTIYPVSRITFLDERLLVSLEKLCQWMDVLQEQRIDIQSCKSVLMGSFGDLSSVSDIRRVAQMFLNVSSDLVKKGCIADIPLQAVSPLLEILMPSERSMKDNVNSFVLGLKFAETIDTTRLTEIVFSLLTLLRGSVAFSERKLSTSKIAEKLVNLIAAFQVPTPDIVKVTQSIAPIIGILMGPDIGALQTFLSKVMGTKQKNEPFLAVLSKVAEHDSERSLKEMMEQVVPDGLDQQRYSSLHHYLEGQAID